MVLVVAAFISSTFPGFGEVAEAVPVVWLLLGSGRAAIVWAWWDSFSVRVHRSRPGEDGFFAFAGDHKDIDGAAVPDQVVHQG